MGTPILRFYIYINKQKNYKKLLENKLILTVTKKIFHIKYAGLLAALHLTERAGLTVARSVYSYANSRCSVSMCLYKYHSCSSKNN